MQWARVVCATAVTMIACRGEGQQTESELLRKQLKEANENFEKAVQEHRAIIQQLNRKIDALQTDKAAPTTNSNANVAVAPAPLATEAVPAPPAPSSSWSPAQPIRVGAGQNYLNLSFDGLFAAGSSTA